MAEDESGMEKSELPTSYKLEKAREKGNVPKSQEINSISVLIVSILSLYLYGPTIKSSLAQIMQGIILESSKIELNVESVRIYFLEGVGAVASIIMPVLLTIGFVAIVSNIAQIGFLWTTEPLVPKFEKFFDPKSFYKRFFSLDILVQLTKDLLKTVITTFVGYITIKEEIDNFMLLIDFTVVEIFAYATDVIMTLLIRITAVLVVLAILDKLYSSWKFTNDMKMTKQEVKEEQKNYDMPKEIKEKIAKKQMQTYMGGMMEKVPEADVIITNPIHVAVAIKYKPGEMQSPKVVAKGLRLIADRIKTIAMENDVPIMENPPLARGLYKKVELDQEIPEEFFKAVAEVLAYIYKIKKK
ncbi:MAG: flagellar biosynthesis protein FlhB [Candidatus Cloacimonadota bacterium]|nr:MAG: flagellar biosynthesis protein FlhB [Candidatus Cloacimonadota bacterium]PIE78398.1 MAG: flagellar biosynthesis protein FlhB [Candidatus Delongbacteria bacterium]